MSGHDDHRPADLTPHQEKVIQKVANAIAASVDGSRYQQKLVQETKHNHHFAFLDPQHEHYAYFQYLLIAYTRYVQAARLQQAQSFLKQQQQQQSTYSHQQQQHQQQQQQTSYQQEAYGAGHGQQYHGGGMQYTLDSSIGHHDGYQLGSKRDRPATPPGRHGDGDQPGWTTMEVDGVMKAVRRY